MALTVLGSTSALAADPAQDTGSLMKRGEKLEMDIAQHQREARQAGGASAAQYDQGFHDGYNKAVLDLVKSKLMAAHPDTANNLASKNAGATTLPAVVPAAPVAPAAANSNVAFWIGKSVASLQDSLDYLRLSIKYLLFDLEATRRENSYLRKMLEESDNNK